MNPSGQSTLDPAHSNCESFLLPHDRIGLRFCPNSDNAEVVYLWVDPLSELGSLGEQLPARGWYTSVADNVQATTLWYRKLDASCVFVASAAKSHILDQLLDQHGPPPKIVLDDWQKQLANRQQLNIQPSDQLGWVTASSNGLLQSVPAIASSITARERTSGVQTSNPVNEPQRIEQLETLLSIYNNFDSRTTSIAPSKHATQTLLHFFATEKERSQNNPLAADGVAGDVALEPISSNAFDFGNKKQTVALNGKKIQDKLAKKKSKLLPIWVGSGVVACLAIFYLLSPTPKKSLEVATGKEPHKRIAAEVAPVTKSAAASNSSMKPSSSNETSKSSSEELVLIDPVSVGTVPSTPNVSVDLADELKAKLQTEMDSSAGDSDEGLDASKLASITKLLEKKNSQPEPTDETTTDTPESSDANSSDANSSDANSIEENSDADLPEVPDTAESDSKEESNPVAVTSKTESLVVDRAILKNSFQMPFRVNDKVAACSVKWDLPSDVLVSPEEPVMMVGKQKQTWTVALRDESCKLIITMQSHPRRKWLLVITVRMRADDGTELPLPPMGASSMVQQNQILAKELAQQGAFLEAIKHSKRGRAVAAMMIPQVKLKQKETDQLLEQWKQVDALGRAFYQGNKLNIEFLVDTASH